MGPILMLFCSLLLRPVLAQSAEEPMTFKNWKDQQIIYSQNMTARINNRIVLFKAGQIKVEDIITEFGNLHDEKANQEKLTARAQKLTIADILTRLERELNRSQKAAEYAKGLTLQEYFLGYISQFQDSPDALATVASQLSREEVTELLKFLFRTSQSGISSAKSARLKSTLGQLEANTAF
jgi:hypothetical protein